MERILKKRFSGLLATGWGVMRILRLAMGMAGLIFAIRNQDIFLGFAGGFLLLMGFFNFGCSAAGSCSVPVNNSTIRTASKDLEEK